MNADLKNKIMLALFGLTGPVAKYLSIQLHLDNDTIKMILDICMLLTPSVAGWAMAQMSTIANKVAHIQVMSPNDQATIAAALPVEAKVANLTRTDAKELAAALPDAATLAAVNAMPDVKTVLVEPNATDGVGEALRDGSLQKVVSR